jgi:glycine/D-amino acid oxidase-like deaminating enzyme
VVVGGGLAGLTTAWLLARKGEPVVLLEAGPESGGRMALPRGGEPGAHLLVLAYDYTLRLAGMLGEKVFYRPPKAVLELRSRDSGGRLRLGGGRTGEAVGLLKFSYLPLRERLSLLWRLARPLPAAAGYAHAASWINRWFPGRQRRFWELLCISIFAAGPEEVDGELWRKTVERLFGFPGRAAPVFFRNTTAMDLVRPLQNAARSAGVALHTGERAVKLEFAGGNISAVLTERNGYRCRRCILALPPETSARLLGETRRPRYSSVATVYLRTSPPLPGPSLRGFPGEPFHWLMERQFGEVRGTKFSLVVSGFRSNRRELLKRSAEFLEYWFPGRSWIREEIFVHHRAVPVQDGVFCRWRREFLERHSSLEIVGAWTEPGLPVTIEAAVRSAFRVAGES